MANSRTATPDSSNGGRTGGSGTQNITSPGLRFAALVDGEPPLPGSPMVSGLEDLREEFRSALMFVTAKFVLRGVDMLVDELLDPGMLAPVMLHHLTIRRPGCLTGVLIPDSGTLLGVNIASLTVDKEAVRGALRELMQDRTLWMGRDPDGSEISLDAMLEGFFEFVRASSGPGTSLDTVVKDTLDFDLKLAVAMIGNGDRASGNAGSGPAPNVPVITGENREARDAVLAKVSEAWIAAMCDLVAEKFGQDRLDMPASLIVVEGMPNFRSPYLGHSELYRDTHGSGHRGDCLGVRVVNGCRRGTSDELRSMLASGHLVVLSVGSGALLEEAEMQATGPRVDMSDITPALHGAIRHLRKAQVDLRLDTGQRLDAWLSAQGLVVPGTAENTVYQWLCRVACARDGVSAKRLEMLGRIVAPGNMAKPVRTAALRPGDPRGIEEVPGLADRTRREIAALMRDLSADEGSPEGTVLVGPPGCGKTMLGRILAATCGRTYVEASVTSWLACGHLGEALKAMRESFVQARAAAPSVLFLDELDSMPSRAVDHGRNSQWYREFVNAFLELLDGIASRGNVAVVSATNDASSLDPAMVRSGRLSRRIEIGMPDPAGRVAILRHHMAENGGLDLDDLARRAGECTPSDLALLVREARKIGRAAGLPLHASIEQAFSERVASLYPAADLERMRLPVAIGVCSQALLARLSYADDVTIHGLSVAPGLADLGRVQMEHVNGQFPAGTAEDLSRLLQIAVAPSEGRLAAARPGGTPGLGSLALMIEESREERARIQKLAGRLVASGAFPMKGPEDTSGAVRHARAQASGILRVNMDAVLATARVLAVRTSITGAEAEEILFGAGDRLPN